jgi:ABC-type sugar transport system ATPase subunit
LHAGEILGLFGLLGSGCGAVAAAVFGSWPGSVRGSLRINGTPASIDQPSDAIAYGLGLLSQDRREALVHAHSVADNVVLASLDKISRWGVIDRDQKRLVTKRYVDQLSIRTPSTEALVATLSGGNQQKVQVARWLATGSRILLLVDPTRGVDVGARAEINRLWQELAIRGFALLLVSSEVEELVEICDRVLVMHGGRLVAELHGDEITSSRLVRSASGV